MVMNGGGGPRWGRGEGGGGRGEGAHLGFPSSVGSRAHYCLSLA